jgi:hypothetical protein
MSKITVTDGVEYPNTRQALYDRLHRLPRGSVALVSRITGISPQSIARTLQKAASPAEVRLHRIAWAIGIAETRQRRIRKRLDDR